MLDKETQMNNETTCAWCEREQAEDEVTLPADGITEETTIQTCSACTSLLTEDDAEVVVTPLADKEEQGEPS
jgi:hypothetical protein